MWGHHVMRYSISDMDGLVDWIRVQASDITAGRKTFCSKVSPPRKVLLEIVRLGRRICQNKPRSSKVSPGRGIIASDASLSGWGWVYCGFPDSSCWAAHWGHWGTVRESREMFLLELTALVRAIDLSPCSFTFFVLIDNEGLWYALQKGKAWGSAAPVMLELQGLLEVRNSVIIPVWIPTHLNPADYWSRLLESPPDTPVFGKGSALVIPNEAKVGRPSFWARDCFPSV